MNETPRSEGSLVQQLRRRWPLILLALIVAGGASYGFSSARKKTYTSSALVLVRPSSPATTIVGTEVPGDSATQQRSIATIVALTAARPLAVQTARKVPGVSADDVKTELNATVDPNDNLVHVAFTDRDPGRAAKLANTFARVFIAAQSASQRADTTRARAALEQRFAGLPRSGRTTESGKALSAQIERLRELEAVAPSLLSVVQPATLATKPNSSVKRDTALGALFGLMLGIAIALVREQLDRRVKKEDDLEETLGLPVLGEIPTSRAIRRGRPLADLPPGEREAFRLLWTRLRYGSWDREMRRVLVTSAGPQEGKSTISWYLASVAAAGGESVLLIEADVRRPVAAKRHDLENRPGLLGLVRDQVPFEQAVSQVDVGVEAASDNGGQPHQMHVLTAGGYTDELTELATTERLIEFFEASEILASYDRVIVDAPPVGLAAEAIPLSKVVDGVLIASRAGHTDKDALAHVGAQLDRLEAETIGLVLDGRSSLSYQYYAGSRKRALTR